MRDGLHKGFGDLAGTLTLHLGEVPLGNERVDHSALQARSESIEALQRDLAGGLVVLQIPDRLPRHVETCRELRQELSFRDHRQCN